MKNKILFILFLLLLLIITGELIYFLNLKRNIKPNLSNNNSNLNNINNKIKNGVPLTKAYPNLDKALERIFLDINYHGRIYLVVELLGQVIEIDKTGQKSFNPQILKWGIKTQNKNMPDGHWMYFTNLGLNDLEVFLKKREDLIKINKDEIKINDKIIIRSFINLEELIQKKPIEKPKRGKTVIEIYR